MPECCEIEDISESTWVRVAYADSGRLRLIELIGVVGRDLSVPVLRRFYTEGSLPSRSACLRGLRGADQAPPRSLPRVSEAVFL